METKIPVIEEVTDLETIRGIYPKFDLNRNTVTVYKGMEFDINDFACLQVLTNHDPEMVDMVNLVGDDVIIYYYDGTTRIVNLAERKVLWERYTLFLQELRRKMLPPKVEESKQLKITMVEL